MLRRRDASAGRAKHIVARLKQREALREEKIWSDENHPDLVSQEDINRYLSEMRGPGASPFSGTEKKQ